MKLSGKTAIITGGTGGIGKATAELFLAQGANVMLSDLDSMALKAVENEMGNSRLATFKADVSNAEENTALVEACIARFGGVDILFANAGIEGKMSPIESYPNEMFDKVLDVNVKGVFYGIKAIWPHFKKKKEGNIIITSSVAGLQGSPQLSAYVTSKHAVIGLMRTAALEGAEIGIRVNSIHPGPIENRMMRSIEEGLAPGAAEQVKAGFTQIIPMKRYGYNHEIANMALFLASNDSSYCTGSRFVVDGGLNAG